VRGQVSDDFFRVELQFGDLFVWNVVVDEEYNFDGGDTVLPSWTPSRSRNQRSSRLGKIERSIKVHGPRDDTGRRRYQRGQPHFTTAFYQVLCGRWKLSQC